MLTEERQVVVAHREVQVYGRFLAVLRGCDAVLCTFYQVLERGRARTVAVFMEQEQTFRQIAVVHVLQQVTHRFLPLLACQLRTESKAVFMRQEILNKRRLNAVLEVLEQVLEHTACRTGCGHELQDLVSLRQVLLPCGDILLLLRAFRRQDTLLGRCRRYDV